MFGMGSLLKSTWHDSGEETSSVFVIQLVLPPASGEQGANTSSSIDFSGS